MIVINRACLIYVISFAFYPAMVGCSNSPVFCSLDSHTIMVSFMLLEVFLHKSMCICTNRVMRVLSVLYDFCCGYLCACYFSLFCHLLVLLAMVFPISTLAWSRLCFWTSTPCRSIGVCAVKLGWDKAACWPWIS